MYSFNEKSISEAKQELPGIVREASNGYETIARNFKSNKESRVSIISTELLEEILDNGFKFNPIVEEDRSAGGWTVALPELLVHGDGDTLYAALQDLAENLMDYAADYLARVSFFRQVENRRGHFPYLRRIARFNEIQKVMEVIAECHTGLQQAISKQSAKRLGLRQVNNRKWNGVDACGHFLQVYIHDHGDGAQVLTGTARQQAAQMGFKDLEDMYEFLMDKKRTK